MTKVEADTIELQIPCDPKYIGVARLVAAGVGAHSGLNADEIDDLKVAVSEACTNVIDHAFPDSEKTDQPTTISLRFTSSKTGLQVEVEDYGVGFDPDNLPKPELNEPSVNGGLGLYLITQLTDEVLNEPSVNGGLGLYLITQLTDEVHIQSAPDSGTKIIMIKRVTE